MTTKAAPKTAERKVRGVNYKLQHPGARWYLNLQDRAKNRMGVLQQEKYVDDLLENVVVSPKVSIDELEDVGVIEELITEIETFLRGQ